MSDSVNKGIDLEQELTTGFAARLIRCKSKKLVYHGKYTQFDRPDIEQELRIAVYDAFDTFDPDVAHWKVFVKTVVEREASNLLERRKAEKREHVHDVTSLSVLVEDEDGELVPLSTKIGEEHREPLTGRVRCSDEESFDHKEDVAAVLDNLPDDLRDLCERLKEKSVAEVARDLGIPRSTLRDRISKLREHFDAGECED